MRAIVFLLATCTVPWILDSSALAQGASNGIEEPERESTNHSIAPASAEKPQKGNEEVDVKLYAFCQGAILRDRGLSNSPVALGSDRWIVEQLLEEKEFVRTFDGLRSDSGKGGGKQEAKREDSARRTRRQTAGVVDSYTNRSFYTEKLEKQLTDEGLARLPYVYLQLEGLIALTRPEFQEIFDQPKVTQDKIREIANKVGAEKALPHHQALFALPDFEQAPIYAAELRRVSAELDWEIVKILNPAERVRLLDTIRRSRRFENVVHGPGAY